MKLYVARILPDALVFVGLVSANADFKLLADVVQGYQSGKLVAASTVCSKRMTCQGETLQKESYG